MCINLGAGPINADAPWCQFVALECRNLVAACDALHSRRQFDGGGLCSLRAALPSLQTVAGKAKWRQKYTLGSAVARGLSLDRLLVRTPRLVRLFACWSAAVSAGSTPGRSAEARQASLCPLIAMAASARVSGGRCGLPAAAGGSLLRKMGMIDPPVGAADAWVSCREGVSASLCDGLNAGVQAVFKHGAARQSAPNGHFVDFT